MKLTNSVILILILIVASILRLYNLYEIPYTNDEFSALSRTHFNNFSDLINLGTIIDAHPAGIQVFLYYWTKIFGYSEWIVKLPFITMGVSSVLLVYLIAKDWYNETVALISASFLASIQYTVMYSQIARPYSSGLFFSLLMVYFWTKIILTPQKKFYINSFFFIIGASLCSYNHHFSLLFAAIVGISGLFFIEKKYLIKYMICGVCIFLLYIPHLRIFLYQLNTGGVENWLGKPNNDFIINYISYIFNFSTLVYILVLSLILFGLFRIKKQDFNFKYIALFTCWFILPFLIGFFYSIYINSVLQYSVLIFSFPYLFFVLFGQIKPQNTIANLFIVVTILSINIYSLIKERNHYTTFYHSHYKEILLDHQKFIKTHSNAVSIIDSYKAISNVYIKELNLDTSFIWYDSFASKKDLIAFLENKSQSSKYLYLGAASGIDPIVIPIIQEYYPTLELQKNYVNGTTYIFSNTKSEKSNIIDYNGFELKEKKFWSAIEKNNFIDTVYFSGKTSYLVDNKTEWSPTYARSLEEIILNENNFIDVSVRVYLPEKCSNITLATSLESKDKNIYWSCTPFDTYSTNNQFPYKKWIQIHHSLKLSDVYLNYPDIQLKVYVCNPDKCNFLIDDFTIQLRTGNPIVYGLNEKIYN